MPSYTVTGPTAFQGHAPGTTFTADLDPGLEARAVERGSIAKEKGVVHNVKPFQNPSPDLSDDHPERSKKDD